jgi:molecular chaperone DnaK (HSP70)/Tfp pilus assembly protein PilF
VLGIDLGTTNSTAAEINWHPDHGAPSPARCLEVEQPTSEGTYIHALVPSVVAIHGGQILVGEGAKRLRARAAELGLSRNLNLFYECKNDIGIEKTYHRAPTGFRSAAEIGGKVIKFFFDAASAEDPTSLARVVVTVPASFQAAQRHDTLMAAELAGLKVQGGDLLDEPVAAFLDYLVGHFQDLLPALETPKNLVVFDFGGGTCDVAVFQVRLSRAQDPLQISPMAVSRYHRLGGGDIDTAILHEVLIPQLCSQNNLSPLGLSFEEKKHVIEPAYLSMAEALKISLCCEILRLSRFDKYEAADKSQIISRQPGVHECRFKEQTLTLQSPTLTAADFERLLAPFLDRDFLFARETEYRLTCSIFAPLQDALDRAGLDPKEVDLCLAVGGSSLLPQVIWAIGKFMTNAQMLSYPDQDSIQTAVARGAAYHALCLALYGKSLLRPVCHDRIAIKTQSGLVDLIPQGASLPYPPDGGYAVSHALAVPETALMEKIDLRVEIVAGEEERVLFCGIWQIPNLVNRGDPLRLEFRYDENQVLDLRLGLAENTISETFQLTRENPFTNVVNPQAKRLEIDRLEEAMRTGKVPREQLPEKLVVLAKDYAELGQWEKAVDLLKRALRARNRPDAYILNLMGLYYDELKNYEKAAKHYREASRVAAWGGPWFNLALSQERQGKNADALESIAKAIDLENKPPYRVLKARLAGVLEKPEEREANLAEAFNLFGPVSMQDDWELGWFLTGAQMAGDQQKVEMANTERRRRLAGSGPEAGVGGELPIITQGLQKVDK